MLLAAQSIAEFVDSTDAWPISWLNGYGAVVAAVIHALVLIHVFAVSPFAFIWLERNGVRTNSGPTRANPRRRPVRMAPVACRRYQADSKEDLCPPAADSLLFRSAPTSSAWHPSQHFWYCHSAIHGWPSQLIAVCFILLAILSLEVFGIILAGYASGSKWSLFVECEKLHRW